MLTAPTQPADDDRERARLTPWLYAQDASVRRDELMLALQAVAESGGVCAAWEAVLRWSDDHRDVLLQHLAQYVDHYYRTRGLYLDARRGRNPKRRGKPRKRRKQRHGQKQPHS